MENYDPTSEPTDSLNDDSVSPPVPSDQSAGQAEAPKPEVKKKRTRKKPSKKKAAPRKKPAKVVDPEGSAIGQLVADLTEVVQATPAEFAQRDIVNARVADTGRTLTDRQATTVLRLQGYLMADREDRATYEDRRYGKMPCTKAAHSTLWLLDRLSDLLEEIDGQAS